MRALKDGTDVRGIRVRSKREIQMNEELVRKSIGVSKESFCELYGLYKDRLYRYALYRLGSPEDAEDAVSDCVLQAWKGIPGLKDPKAFGSWIFRILSACCAKRIKEMIGDREYPYLVNEDGYTDPSGDTEKAVLLAEALSILKDDERDIVLLSVIAGLTSSEIAGQTGLRPGAVRSKLSRSLARMREFLSQGESL